ncbi:DUF7601 domain-containing protein [Peptoanaerobacter stomatis]
MRPMAQLSRLRSFILALVLLISSISVPQSSYAEGTGKDVTDILKPETVVKQDNKVIEEGENIIADKGFRVDVNFKVPVKLDGKPQYVKQGDFAKIKLGKGIKVTNPIGDKPIIIKDDKGPNHTGRKIGTAKFVKDGDNVVLDFQFDGDKYIFEERKGVQVDLYASFELDEKADDPNTPQGNKFVEILKKKYNLIPGQKSISMRKEGKVDYNTKTITWKVFIDKNKYFGQISLDGFEFYDNLFDVGDYIKDTFKVGKTEDALVSKTPTFDKDKIETDKNGNKVKSLTYKFDNSSTTPIVIEFKTEIKFDDFYLRNDKKESERITKTNTAFIRKDKEEYKAVGEVEIDKMWTQKKVIKDHYVNGHKRPYRKGDSEKGEDSNSYYVDWTVEFNHEGKSLENVKIKDELLKDTLGECYLEFAHSKLEVWNKETKKYEVKDTSIRPVGSIYTIGDINTKIKFTITTKINPNGINVDLEKTKRRDFKNVASVIWGKDGKLIVEHFASMSIGETILTKDFVKDKGSYIGQTIKWNIKVYEYDKYSPKTSSYLYDMIIFKNSPNAIYKLKEKGEYKIFDSTGTEVTNLDGMDITKLSERKKIVPKFIRYNKYLEDSFNFDKTIKHKVYKIYANDEYIGDLLEIYGFDPNKKDYNFTFNTVITDPQTLLGDGRISIANYAHLFEGKKQVAVSESWPEYNARMITKQALPATVSRNLAEKLKEGQDVSDLANQDIFDDTTKKAIDNKAIAFDKKTNSVIFRLSVNASGMDNTIDENGKHTGESLIGDVILEDILPDGWKFEDIQGKQFLIFEGEAYNNEEAYENIKNENIKRTRGVVKAKTLLGDTSDFLKADFKDNTVKFTFNKIDKPYVILLRAKITDDAFKAYVNRKVDPIKNTATVRIGKNKAQDSQLFDISNEFLKKSVDKEDMDEKGYLTWTVEYDPDNYYAKDKKVKYIEDKLGAGMSFRTEPSGELSFKDGNYKVEQWIFDDNSQKFVLDKTYTEKSDLEKFMEYHDNQKNILRLNIIDNTKKYKFIYVTDVNGQVDKIQNEVTLFGEDGKITDIPTVKHEFTVSGSGGGSASEGLTQIKIIKTDKNKALLKGAQFNLKQINGNINRTRITDSNGELIFGQLTAGKYILEEIQAPQGYVKLNKTYNINITQNNGVYKAVVEKEQGDTNIVQNENVITVINEKMPPTPPPTTETTSASLSVNKRVVGDKWSDPDDEFTFAVKFISENESQVNEKYKYYKNGAEAGTIGDGEQFKLKDGEQIEIKELPAGIRYTLTEIDYKEYKPQEVEKSGQITTANLLENSVEFINETTTHGQLRIEKEVVGSDTDKAEKFRFTVKIGDNPNKVYKYKDGTIIKTIAGGAETVIELGHGEHILIEGIKLGTRYQVTEAPNSNYSTTVNGQNGRTIDGTITESDDNVTVKFVNTRKIQSSQLKIEKRVEGNAADTTKLFDFVVKIGTDENKEYKYEVKKINGDGTIVRQGTIKSGGTIQLAHEEYAVISDIESGIHYSVEETVTSSDGYTTTVNDVNGKTVTGDITENGAVVKFVNTRKTTSGGGGGGGDDPTPPGPSNDPQTPPTVPDRDRPTPSVPTYPIDDTPNPNAPNSPDNIVVSDEDGVPLGTYTKQTKPDGTVEYVDEDGVPLGVRKLVKTGNEFPEIPLMMTSVLSLFGFVVLRRYRRKNK